MCSATSHVRFTPNSDPQKRTPAKLAVALVTFDRKSVELVLLVVGVLRDTLILGWRFRPHPLADASTRMCLRGASALASRAAGSIFARASSGADLG
jgi:hypothetical protein